MLDVIACSVVDCFHSPCLSFFSVDYLTLIMIQENGHYEPNCCHYSRNHLCHWFHFEGIYWIYYSSSDCTVMSLDYKVEVVHVHLVWCTSGTVINDSISQEFLFSIHYCSLLSCVSIKFVCCLLVLVNCRSSFHFRPDDIPVVSDHLRRPGCFVVIYHEDVHECLRDADQRILQVHHH